LSRNHLPRFPVDVQPGGRTRLVTWTHATRGHSSTGDWFRGIRTREVALGSPSYPVPSPGHLFRLHLPRRALTRKIGSTTRTAFVGAEFYRRCLPQHRRGTSAHRFQPASHGVEPLLVSRSFVAPHEGESMMLVGWVAPPPSTLRELPGDRAGMGSHPTCLCPRRNWTAGSGRVKQPRECPR